MSYLHITKVIRNRLLSDSIYIDVPTSRHPSHSPVRRRPQTDDTMKAVLFLAVAGWLAGICCAHMCLLYPKQRGTLNGYDRSGSSDCGLQTPDCGGRRKSSNNMAAFTRGSNHTVMIQKNIDHHPGSFEIVLMNQPESSLYITRLASIPDTNEPSLAVYYVNVQIPSNVPIGVTSEYILQVVYNTNAASQKYYECADILIT